VQFVSVKVAAAALIPPVPELVEAFPLKVQLVIGK
jgi:hypothetical protein